jgi:RNA polymerase sigma-70 factor (ECF subfamily)
MVKSNSLISNYRCDDEPGDAPQRPLVDIIRHHERAILKTCRRWLHDRQDVEDAAQETYLRLFRMSDDVRTNAAGLAYTCAVHVSIDINRRRRTRRQREAVVAAEASRRQLDHPRHAGNEGQIEHEVHTALQKLEPRLRDLIVQKYFLNRAQVDLALEAGVSPSTMSRRLDRAIQHLRTHLGA